METMSARAFLHKLLSESERKELFQIEKNFPPGRYWQGFEICRHFHLKPEPLDEAEVQQMDALWRDYRKTILWKKQALENLKHDKECQPHCKCTTDLEEIYEWQTWALMHFAGSVPVLAAP